MSATSAAAATWVFGVNVGQDRHADFFADQRERAESGFDAGAAKGFSAGAVSLVVAGFEDEENAEFVAGFFSDAATSRQSFSLSMTQGPAMRLNRTAH